MSKYNTSTHSTYNAYFMRRYTSLWTRSYFVETVGHISEKTVVNYIEQQKINYKALSSPGLSQGEFPG